MIPFIGTGPTPGVTEAQYRRRKQIIQKLYNNAANETSERMVQRLARSWSLDHTIPEGEQKRDKDQGTRAENLPVDRAGRTKTRQKQDGKRPLLIG